MTGKTAEMLHVEVVYALPGETTLIPVAVEKSSTIADAIRASGIERLFPQINLDWNKVGVFGHIKSLLDEINEGDRIEIYRPLTADPKENRRRREAVQKPG